MGARGGGLGVSLRANLVSVGLAVPIALAVFMVHLVGESRNLFALMNLESKLVDLRFLIRGVREPEAKIAIVAIDSKSIQRIGRWPWARTTHAELVDRLRGWGASAVAYDILFTESEGAREARLLRSIEASLPRLPRQDGQALLAPTREAIAAALAEVETDRTFAEVLERTYADDAALTVMGFDFMYVDEVRHAGQLGEVLGAEDEQLILDLASYLSRDANSVLMRQRPPRLAVGIPPVVTTLAEWCAALGFAKPLFDKDGAVRREQLVVVYGPQLREAFAAGAELEAVLADPAARVQGYMPLGVAAAATHLRLSADQVVLDLPAGEVRLEPAAEAPCRLAFDRSNGSVRLDFCGPTASFPTYSFVDVLADEVVDANGARISGSDAFGGHLVFVGATDPGLQDFLLTPFTGRLPGVEKHATVAENLLAGRQLVTPEDPDLVIGVLTLVGAIIAAVLAANLSPSLASLSLFLVGVGWLGFTTLEFAHAGTVWNWAVPGLSTLLAFASVIAYRVTTERRARHAMEARSRFVQDTFGRYLSDEVVAHLVDSPEGLEMGGERRRLTILMSDLRGFTALSDRSTPEVVTGLLNYYLGRMTEIIFKHRGTIDEFIGDAILALFGAPEARDDDALRAVACAIEMQRAMAEVNAHLEAQGFPAVEMGIALNTGEVIVGNIGSEMRSKYGVVGTNVNLTARIESCTTGGQVFISEATLREAGEGIETGLRIEVSAKGLSEPLVAYELLAMGPPYDLEMPKIDEVLIDLEPAIPVQITVLEGKHVSDEIHEGAFVRLSEVGADLRCALVLEQRTDIRLRVIDPAGSPVAGDVYAKVVERAAEAGCFPVRFTATPPEVAEYLRGVLHRVSE